MDTHYDVSGAHIASRYRPDVVALPPALRQLLENELAAGNAIIDVGHSHPAPPIGAYIKLAQRVSTRERRSADGISFRERNSSLYHGEFTDADRRYWILEPPEPDDAAYPDQDAIRAAHEPPPFDPLLAARIGQDAAIDESVVDADAAAYRRFVDSMRMDYDRWREGIGYDLDALRALSNDSRRQLERKLTPPSDWRDVEALVAIDSTSARATLQHAARSSDVQLAVAVLRHTDGLIDDATRTAILVHAISHSTIMFGLSGALDEMEEFHPPEIERALFAGLLTTPGDVAYHCAATLAVVHGVIESRVDWSMRPLFLEFNTTDDAARRTAFVKLCRALRLDGETLLADTERFISSATGDLS